MSIIHLNAKLISNLGNVLLMSYAEIIDATSIPNTTWYKIKNHPEEITIQQLLALSNGLKIPVRRFFSTEQVDIIGKREDYVVDHYESCRYDAQAIKMLVTTHADVTWQKAAQATGMAPIRLRDSLLGTTRTPAVRFLTVCEAFDVDPFDILIDPNQEEKPANSKGGDTPTTANTKDIYTNMRKLSATVSDLSKKYEHLAEKYDDLLEAHKALSRRFNDHIEQNYIGMAAEP